MSDIITAAMIIIGDEILSGRTKDKNIGHLADIMTAIGVDLKEVVDDLVVDAARQAEQGVVLRVGGKGVGHGGKVCLLE